MLKVKITKCKEKEAWYSKHIGKIFFVRNEGPIFKFVECLMPKSKITDKFYLVDENIHAEKYCFINKKDCKEVI